MAQQERTLAAKIFLGVLVVVGVLYGTVLIYHVNIPMSAEITGQAGWLEECRQLCAQLGLVATGNLKEDAEAYLKVVDSQKLSTPLQELLNDPVFQRASTAKHPLVGQSAPNFTLTNADDGQTSLADISRKGPVVLVFYYGYSCNHCVAQLFAIQKDIDYFRELGAEVIAISADTPEHTREKYAEYGSFTFPVVSDPDYKVSEGWSVYTRPSGEQEENLLHGTFVIDRNEKVVFANLGYQPFLDNQSLLQWIANSESQVQADGKVTAK